MKVLLVVPPFGLVEYPHLATSLLKSEVKAAGFDCDLTYASIDFAKRIGFGSYVRVYSVDSHLLIAERIFARAVFGDAIPEWKDYWRSVVVPYEQPLNARIRATREVNDISQVLEPLQDTADEFVEDFASRPELGDYDVIGFSTSYGQNCAALALAKRVKERHPNTTIFFGGANCAGGMGEKMIELFPFIDYVCIEDGDLSFPRALKQLDAGEPVDVTGIVHRGPSRGAVTHEMVRNLDQLPHPDFSDYFEAFDFGKDLEAFIVAIPMETSRGCWWGQKHHCVFCGLNRDSMAYRRKSPERIDREIRDLVNTYGVRRIMMTDNIMSQSFVKDTLPRIATDPDHDHLFFETKSNLSKEELHALKAARVGHLQPGIESLSSHVLKLMDKGVSGLQNVQLLKWAKEIGIGISWNILCGFPGENPEDYEAMAALMPKIHHLEPALGFAQITIDRFSPLFNKPEKFGIKIRPVRGYSYIYPFPDEDLEALAYWFSQEQETMDGRASLMAPDYAKSSFQAYRIWKRMWGRVDFNYRYAAPDRVVVHDTRGVGSIDERELNPLETRVFVALDRIASFPGLMKRLSEDGDAPSEVEVRAVLHDFREWAYLAEEDGKMLVLAHLATGASPEERDNSLRATIEQMRGMSSS